MALSSIELWQRIATEGLASPMQSRSWAAETAKSLAAAETTDGLKVLQALIDLGKLTNYQAKILAGQSDHPLFRGTWAILSRVKDPLWKEWLSVTKVDLKKAESPPPNWARWLSLLDLESLRASAPSLPRGLQLANVKHEHLQMVHVPEMGEGELQVLVSPVQGQLLSEEVKSPLPPETVTKIVSQLARGLAAMHAVNLVHGRVLPDRIYFDGEQVTLARDPISVLTATLDPTAIGLLGERLSGLKSIQFFAPEFIAPGQLPTLATDVYALGCTWWWLLTGEPFALGSSPQQVLASHASIVPKLPTELNYAEPLTRCLTHCLAKNVSARFASATAVSQAITEATRVIALGKLKRSAAEPPAKKTPATKPTAPPTAPPTAATTASATKKPAPKPSPKSATVGQVEQKLVQTTENVEAENIRTSQESAAASAISAGRENVADAKLVTAVKVDKQPAKLSPASADKATLQIAAPQPTQATVGSSVESPRHTSQGKAQVAAGSNAEPQGNARSPNGPVAESVAAALTAASPAESLASQPAMDKSSAKLAAASAGTSERRTKRRKKSNTWLLPVAGGCGFIILMLGMLKLSGALEPSNSKDTQANQGNFVPPVTKGSGTGTIVERDPRLDFYNIVQDSSQLWVPPAPPAPIALDLLPPGGQLFISLRPQSLLSDARRRDILATFDEQLTPLLDAIKSRSGLQLESIKQVTVGYYSAKTSGAFPEYALRIELAKPTTLGELKTNWQNPSKAKVGEQELLAGSELAYFIALQPLVDSQSVSEFSVGPIELLRDVAELGGASGPLNSQMESMLRKTDSESDLCILLSPRYLLSEGRGLLATSPARFRKQLESLLGNDPRAAIVQTRFVPDWYFEAQIKGASDRDAPGLVSDLQTKLQELPSNIETWFVDESPDPYWRALALRYPQMLRAVSTYSRFGVEDGSAVLNAYLAPEAAPNLLFASWIALQENATMSGGAVAASTEAATPPLKIEDYLARSIRVSFDREPIEVALELVAQAANEGLPSGTPKLQFVIDGDAFEKGGITRNQPLSNFDMRDKTVRENLTEIAKRGNTVPGADIRSEEQKLIWVLADASDGQKVVTLTTRLAAKASSITLPIEFTEATP